MSLLFLGLSIILSSVRNILSKGISDVKFGTKQFFLTQACILKNCQMKQKIRLQTDSTFLTKLICTIFLKAIQVNVKINQLGERICTM